jgi:hypothetical protein
METNNNTSALGGTILARKSWLSYLQLLFVSLILFIGSVLIGAVSNNTVGIILFATTASWATYRFLVLRSFKIYHDDRGVWIYSGILPWTKGVSGVKWRDLDEAVFHQSMLGWIANSYTVQLSHRYTKTNEIFMTHTAKGRNVSGVINSIHQELARAGSLK